MQAFLEEQSFRTLSRYEFLYLFDVQNVSQAYTQLSCIGRSSLGGRKACDFHNRG